MRPFIRPTGHTLQMELQIITSTRLLLCLTTSIITSLTALQDLPVNCPTSQQANQSKILEFINLIDFVNLLIYSLLNL